MTNSREAVIWLVICMHQYTPLAIQYLRVNAAIKADFLTRRAAGLLQLGRRQWLRGVFTLPIVPDAMKVVELILHI
jgi:hypothetical protein